MTLIPPMPYFGGKTSLAPKIVELFPAHKRYCEPFMGSLAVLLAKPPEQVEVVNDIDSRLVGFWRTLRDRGDELARVCTLTPHSREEYYKAKQGPPPEDELENARQLWVLYTQSVSGAYRRGGWRPQGRTRKSTGMHFSRYAERFEGLAERLAHVSIENLPWQKLIGRFLEDPDMLMYVDPPYLDSTRTGGEQYAHDMSSPQAHVELLSYLTRAQGPIVLSAYESELYDSALSGWEKVRFPTNTQAGNPREEILYMNRPLPRVEFTLEG